MELNAFKLNVEHHIAHLSFNRPEKANSLNEPAWKEMRSVFESLSENAEVRVVILSGEGRHFCAGMDLETLMSQQGLGINDEARKRLYLRGFIKKIQDCITAVEECRKPVLAAIHGGCIGGGINIASACDIRYCSDDAFFTIKEIDLGIVADIGALQRIPSIIQPGMAAELAFTGRKLYGSEAMDIGFVNKSLPSREAMMTTVQGLAEMIASKSPLVVQGIKENLLYVRDHSVRDSLSYVANYNAAMLLSRDLAEAFQAYLEKREPKFD